METFFMKVEGTDKVWHPYTSSEAETLEAFMAANAEDLRFLDRQGIAYKVYKVTQVFP